MHFFSPVRNIKKKMERYIHKDDIPPTACVLHYTPSHPSISSLCFHLHAEPPGMRSSMTTVMTNMRKISMLSPFKPPLKKSSVSSFASLSSNLSNSLQKLVMKEQTLSPVLPCLCSHCASCDVGSNHGLISAIWIPCPAFQWEKKSSSWCRRGVQAHCHISRDYISQLSTCV